MEEKERYEWNSRFDEAIKDNQTGDIVNAVEVLNKQDKRIKELEAKLNKENQKLKERIIELQDREESYINTMRYLNKTRSELLNLPKKIVEEIKKQLFNHFKVKNIEEYEKLSLIDSLFTADTVIEILDTILKNFGGEENGKSNM